MTTLLGISGSLRNASTNSALIRNAARLFAPDTFIEADIRFPLYDGDLESEKGVPAMVQTVADQITKADAVIIATPEYNKSISGVLKNALDWISRADGSPWNRKPVALMSATAGRAGGERAQFALRLCMVPFQPNLVMGPEILVGNNSEQFDDDGNLVTESYINLLQKQMDTLRTMSQG